MNEQQPDIWAGPVEGVDEQELAGGQYRALSRLAVLSVLCGVLSPLVALDGSLGVLAVAGVVLALLAMRRIHANPREVTGLGAARAGLVLSVALGGLGFGWLSYARASEVPHGYTPVAYAELQPDPDQPGELIPPRALELKGKKVFIKGYMYPGRQQFHLKRFIISRDNGTCKFCMPNPRPTDLIAVTLSGDLEAEYTPQLVRLGGRLDVEPEEKAGAWGGVAYRLEADYIK